MENVLQLVLPLAGVVVAVTLLVALGQLVAIRKALEALVKQGRMPAQPARPEAASGQILASAEVAPAETPPVYRPVIVSPPPPPAPVEPLRFEEAPEPVFPESGPAIVSPATPPAPVQEVRFEEASQRVLPIEQAPEPAVIAGQAPGQIPPAYSPANVSAVPPAEPTRSRMPMIIGIVVLVFAIAALAFVVAYTK
jgi:hypothetical protein